MKSNMDNDRLRLAKEALESGSYDKKTIEYIFPELADSEDERIRKELLNAFQEAEDSLYMVLSPHRRESFIAWLEKQGEQEPVEWSEEDKKMLEKVIANIECPPCTTANYKPIREMVDWLKLLQGRYVSQTKQEWSKNDEIALADALWCCKQAASIAKDENDMGNIWFAENWLKSLSPQNRWKPTEEQMKAIMYAKKGLPDTEVGNYKGCVLEELYEQLKAL